jgi:hypothetical protein
MSLILLVTCTSVPKYSSENDTLVLGRLIITRNSTRSRDSATNGVYKAGTLITFIEKDSGRSTKIPTKSEGWFITDKLKAGTFNLDEFYDERTSDNTTYRMTLTTLYTFTVEKGKVNNLGLIEIEVGDRGVSNISINHDIIKNDFSQLYPDSEWNSVTWVNSRLEANQ